MDDENLEENADDLTEGTEGTEGSEENNETEETEETQTNDFSPLQIAINKFGSDIIKMINTLVSISFVSVIPKYVSESETETDVETGTESGESDESGELDESGESGESTKILISGIEESELEGKSFLEKIQYIQDYQKEFVTSAISNYLDTFNLSFYDGLKNVLNVFSQELSQELRSSIVIDDNLLKDMTRKIMKIKFSDLRK